MHQLYQTTHSEHLKPTTGIFNAVINAWARSKDKIAPSRAEQILQWMDTLHQSNPSIQPDKYTFNTGEANKCWGQIVGITIIFPTMSIENEELTFSPFMSSYCIVIHAYAKSGGVTAATKASHLLASMHKMYEEGNVLAKPDTITVSIVNRG